jgi:hypothetical protein
VVLGHGEDGGDGRLKTWGEILMAPLRWSFLLSGVPSSLSLPPCEEQVYKKYRSAEKKTWFGHNEYHIYILYNIHTVYAISTTYVTCLSFSNM